MPQPMNRAANRFGSATGTPLATVSAPQTGTDSSHGSAIVTPTPRRKVRREFCKVFIDSSRWAGRVSVLVIVRRSRLVWRDDGSGLAQTLPHEGLQPLHLANFRAREEVDRFRVQVDPLDPPVAAGDPAF